ncbi:MAG: ABC transporter substrate-binding protein [Aestuariivirga sp.]|nr:ABC transporter substrate-binding protein [Aestuariivirga sp.]
MIGFKTRLLLALGGFALAAAPASASELRVTGFGGSIAEVQRATLLEPFAKASGVKVIEDEWNGEIAKVRAQVESGAVTWDVVQAEGAEVAIGCAEGIYEKLDWSKIGDEGAFLPIGKSTCGLGAVGAAGVMTYDGDKIADGPKTWADFWDVEKWPGKRGMRSSPKETLEIALLADGVAPADVYTVLRTPEGLDRAFAKLDKLKPNILWWNSGAESVQRLASGEVVMTTAWNGRPFLANKNDKKNFKIVWGAGGIVMMDSWVILKGSPNLESAYAFLKFVSEPEAGAAFMKGIPYGVSTKASYDLLSDEERANLPSSPANMATSVTMDFPYWIDNLDSVQERFNTWVAK